METAPSPRLSLGKYQLVRHLATGGMAEVILARIEGIEGFERHVVIKKIRDERAREARFVQMFLDEARLAASLHHNNIVHVHDIGQEDGEYFFTMEYVHGEDTRQLLSKVSKRGEQVPLEHAIGISSSIRVARLRSLRRSWPCTYSIVKKYSPSSSPMSWTCRMLLWWSDAARRASSRNIFTNC